MKSKSFFTLLIATVLCFYDCSETEYVYVTSDAPDTDGTVELEEVDDVCTKMSDENFKEYCYRYFDTNYDWKVSMEEARNVTEIDCSTAENFAGIEYFTNLESFKSTSARYLDLSNNKQLTYICLSDHYVSEDGADIIGDGAPIMSLDLSHNVNMSEINGYAFAGCGRLSNIVFPDNITSIGTMAFYGCKWLFSIQLPESLTSIGMYAFEKCTGLEGITFPDSVTKIWAAAFQSCTALTEITLPENLTTLDPRVFQDCTNLKSVTFPENLTEIGHLAFYYCTSLTSVIFPENLTTIDFGAFGGCGNLETITLPASLTTIEYDAFSGNDMSLNSVSVKATTPPSLGTYAFNTPFGSYSPTLYVPSESIEAYTNSDWAQYFSQILELE